MAGERPEQAVATGKPFEPEDEQQQPLTAHREPEKEAPQVVRAPETVPLLEQIQAGRVFKVTSTEVAQVDKEDVKHTFALRIEAPPETANKILALVQSGAPVFAVVGVRQYRFGAAPPEPLEE